MLDNKLLVFSIQEMDFLPVSFKPSQTLKNEYKYTGIAASKRIFHSNSDLIKKVKNPINYGTSGEKKLPKLWTK